MPEGSHLIALTSMQESKGLKKERNEGLGVVNTSVQQGQERSVFDRKKGLGVVSTSFQQGSRSALSSLQRARDL